MADHILVIANETAASQTLLEAVRGEAEASARVTVIAPVNEPTQGYVVYEDTRRASAGRRLDRTLAALREGGLSAQGFVVETGPVQAVVDALAQLEPKVDEIVVSTHEPERSGWLRRDVVGDIERRAKGIPVKHVVVDRSAGGDVNVLVIANETVVSPELLDRIRQRAEQGAASFLIVAPQGDNEDHADADRRLRIAPRRAARRRHRRTRAGRPPGSVHRGPARRRRRARRRDHRLDVSRVSGAAGCGAISSSGCARTLGCRSTT